MFTLSYCEEASHGWPMFWWETPLHPDKRGQSCNQTIDGWQTTSAGWFLHSFISRWRALKKQVEEEIAAKVAKDNTCRMYFTHSVNRILNQSSKGDTLDNKEFKMMLQQRMWGCPDTIWYLKARYTLLPKLSTTKLYKVLAPPPWLLESLELLHQIVAN